eukprot:10193062-Alexandrium_andersonii.AAC.1
MCLPAHAGFCDWMYIPAHPGCAGMRWGCGWMYTPAHPGCNAGCDVHPGARWARRDVNGSGRILVVPGCEAWHSLDVPGCEQMYTPAHLGCAGM